MLRQGDAPAERCAAPRIAACRSSYWVGRLTCDATYARTRANTSGEAPTLGTIRSISWDTARPRFSRSPPSRSAPRECPSSATTYHRRVVDGAAAADDSGAALGGRPIPNVCIATAASISEHAHLDRDYSFRPQPIAEEPATEARGHSCSHEAAEAPGSVTEHSDTAALELRRSHEIAGGIVWTRSCCRTEAATRAISAGRTCPITARTRRRAAQSLQIRPGSRPRARLSTIESRGGPSLATFW